VPYRSLVTKELAELFAVLSHPQRIRIVEELHGGEKDVNSLVDILGISQSGVSQHLHVLRAAKLIVERKQGRNVFYHLRHAGLASWALDGLKFIGPQEQDVQEFRSAVEKARAVWSDDTPQSS
jgi:DNA-binding transcriptional ArsR family regulator